MTTLAPSTAARVQELLADFDAAMRIANPVRRRETVERIEGLAASCGVWHAFVCAQLDREAPKSATVPDIPADLALKFAELWHKAEAARARCGDEQASYWSGRQSAIDDAAIAAGVHGAYLSARDGGQ